MSLNLLTLQDDMQLHPHSECQMRLKIRDILILHPLQEFEGVFLYKQQIVTHVEILGNLISVDHRRPFSIYTVNDGTGIIPCKQWRKPEAEEQNMADSLGQLLWQKLKHVRDHQTQVGSEFEVGQYVHIIGRVTEYKQQREVDIISIVKMTDANAITHHMFSQPLLYKHHYDIQYQKPDLLTDKRTLDKISLENTLPKILQWLQKKGLYEISQNDIKEVLSLIASDEPCERLTNADTICQMLEDVGHTYKHATHIEAFEVVMNNMELQKAILDIMSVWSKNDDMEGCSLSHIHLTIKNRMEYRYVTTQAIKRCVHIMEEQSEVCCISDGHYLPVTLSTTLSSQPEWMKR